MNAYKPFFRYALLAAVAAVIMVGSLSLLSPKSINLNPGRPILESKESAAHYSPDEDLEDTDTSLLDSAQFTIDVAMYAFTDQKIETSLVRAAKRGVRVRIYRDPRQSADEESRATQKGEQSVIDRLRAIPNIEVRVKAHGRSMHLKAYCVDKKWLRTGSANWSFQGETTQDNDLYVITDQRLVQQFEHDFASMWERPDNAIR